MKLDNVKAGNDECHSVLRIYFVIIYCSPLKTNNRAMFFLPCEVGVYFPLNFSPASLPSLGTR